MAEKYKSGQEISFDGGTWGMIEEVRETPFGLPMKTVGTMS